MKHLMLIAMLALAGCVTYDANDTCRGYGFKPGTDAYAQCLQQEDARMTDYVRSFARRPGY